MKKFRLSALVLAGAMSLSLLTACGGKDTPAESVQPSELPMESMEPDVELPEDLPEIVQTPAATDDPVINAFWDTMVENYEMPEMMDLDETLLQDVYGMDPALLDAWFCKMPFMNTQATEFFMAKVSADNMAAVKTALEARQAALEEQWKQYLPEQLELVQNYKLLTAGDYILFAVSYDAAGAETVFTEAAAQ